MSRGIVHRHWLGVETVGLFLELGFTVAGFTV
jgi:hypothetical protein